MLSNKTTKLIVKNVAIASRHESSSSKTLNWLIQPNRERDSSGGEENRSFYKGHYYHEKLVLGYSRDQMCSLVADVANYKHFAPFCLNSEILENSAQSIEQQQQQHSKQKFNLNAISKSKQLLKKEAAESKQQAQQQQQKSFRAKLEIGYPPIRESYVSYVTAIRPELVKAISRDTNLFEYLITEWKFYPHDRLNRMHQTMTNSHQTSSENSCIVEFYVAFKFRSVLYSQLSGLLIDQIFKQMVSAFTKRAQKLYGPPSIPSSKLN